MERQKGLRKKLRIEENNKGLTIIELIVAMAIMAIAGSALLMLLNTGTSQFRGQSEDIAMQTQAQLLQTQMRDYLSDANNIVLTDRQGSTGGGAYLGKFSSKGVNPKTVLVVINAALRSDRVEREGATVTQDEYKATVRVIAWFGAGGEGRVYFNEATDIPVKGFDEPERTDPADANYEKTYCQEYLDYVLKTVKNKGGFSTDNIENDWPMLAEHIRQFDVYTDSENGTATRVDASLQVALNTREDGRVYNTNYSVAFRNKGVYVSDASKGADTDNPERQLSNANVIGQNTTMTAGAAAGESTEPGGTEGTETPRPRVTVKKVMFENRPPSVMERGNVYSGISAKVSGGSGGDAVKYSIDIESTNGTSIDETTGVLTIGEYETAKKLTVYVRSVEDPSKYDFATVSITEKGSISISPQTAEAIPGQMLTFNASVKDGSSSAVRWSCTMDGGSVPINGVGTTAYVTVPSNISDDKTLFVTAKLSDSITAQATVTVRQAQTGNLVFSPVSNRLLRGGTVTLDAYLDSPDYRNEAQITYSIVNDAGLGNAVRISGNQLQAELSGISYDRSYTLTVRADAYIPSTETSLYKEQTVTIDQVKLIPAAGAITLKAGETKTMAYSVQGIDVSSLPEVRESISPATTNVRVSVRGGMIEVTAQEYCMARTWDVKLAVGDSASAGAEIRVITER